MADTLEAWTNEDALDAGFFGVRQDPTPNHAYTVEGVAAGEPTPETDDAAKQAALDRRGELEARFGGTGDEGTTTSAKASSKSSSSSSGS
jgi:hypothetical protein